MYRDEDFIKTNNGYEYKGIERVSKESCIYCFECKRRMACNCKYYDKKIDDCIKERV